MCLVGWGASFDVLDDYADKPLHALARGGHAEAIRHCVEECGADPDVQDMYGRLPIEVAKAFLPSGRHDAVIKVIENIDHDKKEASREDMLKKQEENFALREKYLVSIGAVRHAPAAAVPSMSHGQSGAKSGESAPKSVAKASSVKSSAKPQNSAEGAESVARSASKKSSVRSASDA